MNSAVHTRSDLLPLPLPFLFLQFWDLISNEHGIDGVGRYSGSNPNEQLDKVNVYWNEGQNATYVPRSECVIGYTTQIALQSDTSGW